MDEEISVEDLEKRFQERFFLNRHSQTKPDPVICEVVDK
jgi:hypothetical protein